MFPFYYIFEREIKNSNTLKNVTDEIRHSFMEREMDDSSFDDNTIVGKEKLFKLDFSSRSPLVFSPRKEFFNYNENTKILPYKIEAFYSILFFLILHFLIHHIVIEIIVSTLFFILSTILNYSYHLKVIDKISKNLN
ncbi:hypothetical protein SAMN06265171_104352 [Chryseobacterium rhizoplanae]|uniref:Uncharacterized protein n=1 Tax=Chryseobacterium rhizoplanae TaxID=1609531 RepID=A0A521D835_9FLAO|nr:hypothetical protein [Chryseobacterium rhizoplanae]SMO67877.1 hypothetical protein SAMN06265171_104352 [Chryseobacterium rhizoplanae]